MSDMRCEIMITAYALQDPHGQAESVAKVGGVGDTWKRAWDEARIELGCRVRDDEAFAGLHEAMREELEKLGPI